MQQSPYVRNMPAILAQLRGEETENDQHYTKEQDAHEGLQPQKLYVYRTDTGGWLTSPTKVAGDDDTAAEDEVQTSIVDAAEQPTEKRPTLLTPRRERSYLLHVLLILFVFILLDSEQGIVTAFFTPTATIVITPTVRTVRLESSAPLGKLLEPITLSESQTVPSTGHGHQNAERARGQLIFYNGSSTPQTIPGGSIYTGQDGIPVETGRSVFVPPANLPLVGQATVIAYAVNKGVSGNIAAGDVDLALSNSLVVKNLTAFTDGQDARDFTIVTTSDIATAAETLKAKVTTSMTAALHGQLLPGQELTPTPCSPTVTADHGVGDEAATVKVTVSENCTAIAYDTSSLQAKAMQLLTAQATKTVGKSYMLYGNVSVTITKATTTQQTVVLSLVAHGTFVYQLSAKMQERIKTLLVGKPRLTALRQLTTFSGIRQVSINGISGNQELPTDPQHIRFLIVFLVS